MLSQMLYIVTEILENVTVCHFVQRGYREVAIVALEVVSCYFTVTTVALFGYCSELLSLWFRIVRRV